MCTRGKAREREKAGWQDFRAEGIEGYCRAGVAGAGRSCLKQNVWRGFSY